MHRNNPLILLKPPKPILEFRCTGRQWSRCLGYSHGTSRQWNLHAVCMALAMKRIPRRGCFSITPRWLKEAKRTDGLRGVYIRRSTVWSETMLLALRILMSHQAVQKHGLRPSRIASVRPHEGRCQLRCPVHRGVIEKQPLRGIYFITSVMKI